MSAHTPGPWEWLHYPNPGWGDHGPDLRSVEAGRIWDEYFGSDGKAKGHNYPDDVPQNPTVINSWGYDAWGIDVSEANAALIAAAPDLLYALQYLQTAHGEQLHDAWDVAERAIAKATNSIEAQ